MFTPNDAGCYIDGGIRNLAEGSLELIHFAIQQGCTDPELISAQNIDADTDNDDDIDVLADFALDAEDFLNTLTPDGYIFTWLDGDFVLISESELEA